MRLQAANLVLDALRTYPRKFRADGVSQEEMEALTERAGLLVQRVSPTSQFMDGEKNRALTNIDATKQAISDSFVDVGSEE